MKRLTSIMGITLFCAAVYGMNGDDPSRSEQVNQLNSDLFDACCEGDAPQVAKLIAEGADVKDKNYCGATPLHVAANIQSIEICALLLDNHADVNAKGIDGATPLHWALPVNWTENASTKQRRWVKQHNLALIEETHRFLLSRGALVNEPDGSGRTALHYAANSILRSLCELLLQRKANVNARDAKLKTPLHMVSSSNYDSDASEVATLFLKNQAEIDARDIYGRTPLHRAVSYNDLCRAEILISHNATINAVDHSGATPLHVAVTFAPDMVELFIKNKAEIHAVDEDGSTPLENAIATNNIDYFVKAPISLLLIQRGAYSIPKEPSDTQSFGRIKTSLCLLKRCGLLRPLSHAVLASDSSPHGLAMNLADCLLPCLRRNGAQFLPQLTGMPEAFRRPLFEKIFSHTVSRIDYLIQETVREEKQRDGRGWVTSELKSIMKLSKPSRLRLKLAQQMGLVPLSDEGEEEILISSEEVAGEEELSEEVIIQT